MLNIGCHLSASAGYLAMGKQTVELGGSTFAFFTRNPRGGQAKAINPDDAAAFMKFASEHRFAKIVAHSPYTLNPCSADEHVREFAYSVFADDMKRMEFTPNNYYNFHPGSHVGQGTDEGIRLICELLNAVITPEQSTTVLLETMAGKGSEVGGKFEELRRIIDGVTLSDKIGVCLDTCHVYDAGYDIVNNLDGVLEEFNVTIGLERLKAVHLNDSKNPFQSHKDRHEKIGDGALGLEALSRITNHSALKHLPFILETPNELDGYAKEIALLKSLYKD